MRDLWNLNNDLIGHREKPGHFRRQSRLGDCCGELQARKRARSAFAHQADNGVAPLLRRSKFSIARDWVRPKRPGLMLSARHSLLAKQMRIAQRGAAEVDQNGQRARLRKLAEIGVGREPAGVFQHHGAGVGESARIIQGLIGRIGAVCIDIKADGVADGGADRA